MGLDGDADKNVNDEAIREFEPDRRQWERWALQSVARGLIKHDKRLSKCCRWMLGGTAQVIKAASGMCSYAGVETCGSVWRCAVCASKIAHRRRFELQTLMRLHKENGGSVALCTRTSPHYEWERLEPLLEKIMAAEDRFRAGRSAQAWRRMLGIVGTVRALEVTHGASGFHVHTHALELVTSDDWVEDREFRADMQDTARLIWSRACERSGLGVPDWEHGLRLEGGVKAADYVSKWGIEDELTKSHVKRGKLKGRTPFDLLRAVLEDDDQAAGDLFREYAKAFYRKRQLRWSKGLRDTFGLGEEMSDEDLAAQAAEGAILGELEFSDWRLIVKADAQWAVLSAAQDHGWAGVVRVLEGLRNV